MFDDLNGVAVTIFHDERLMEPDWPAAGATGCGEGVWHWIEQNHFYNTSLWHEEDKARRTDVAPAEIARSKRLIDAYNQKRNDAVESMDECILAALSRVTRPLPGARLHSETAGSMIDRLSILSLKIHHMRLQTQRKDVDRGHIDTCAAKLKRLIEQRSDLRSCLDSLLSEALRGQAYFKVYRQFKMYNDPSLNPCLYGTRPGSGMTSLEAG